jgi:hypothetical protein
MDSSAVRIICAALVVAFGVLIFMRRRGRNTE